MTKVQGLAAGVLLLLSGPLMAEHLEIKVPDRSDDGSYVLRVNAEQAITMNREGKQLEIYRNKDGGEFKRLMLAPGFSAISELVRENGVYGYKARWVHDSPHISDRNAEFSEPVYITVASSVPRVVPSRKDRLVSINSTAASARTP